jgi:hypothetical protein
MLSALALAFLIGGQFLAAIVMSSSRRAIYGEFDRGEPPSSERSAAALQQEQAAKAA